jgi:hypothetical protein
MKKPTGVLKTELIEAARSFLETMVVVDDNIRLVKPATPDESKPIVLKVPGYGPGASEGAKDGTEGLESPLGDDIDLHGLLRGAAAQRLICSLLDPLAFKKDEAVAALIPVLRKADICVLDWRIEGFDEGELALELLEALIDPAAPVRHRVFCIYSHFDQPEAAFKIVMDRLGNRFSREGTKFVLKHRNVVVLWLAKENIPSLLGSVAHVKEEALAEHLVESFALLRPGLIPLFAMKALANVRAQTLGILARYSEEGDRGFVAEMVLQSDSDTSDAQLAEAVGDDLAVLVRSVFDGEWLAPGVLLEWLNLADVKVDEATAALNPLNVAGQVDGGPLEWVANTIRSEESDAKARQAIASVLAGSNERSLKIFAELMCCEIQIGGGSPHLKPGSLVKHGAKYLVCVQPLCDSYLRSGQDERRFPFVPLVEQQAEPHIAFRDGTSNRVQYVRPKLFDLVFHRMKKNTPDRVEAVEGKYVSEGENPETLEHVSILRTPHAQRILALLGFDAGRVGLSESEFYRKKARKEQ